MKSKCAHKLGLVEDKRFLELAEHLPSAIPPCGQIGLPAAVDRTNTVPFGVQLLGDGHADRTCPKDDMAFIGTAHGLLPEPSLSRAVSAEVERLSYTLYALLCTMRGEVQHMKI
jgi:hypothetical protein